MDSHAALETTTPWVRRWLRAEGLAGLALGWVVWQSQGGEIVWFVPLLLTPDISMLGYLRNAHLGAITYNLAHNWLTGGIVVAIGAVLAIPALTMAGAILVAHTGMDRLFGYGLKYPTAFHDTHLGRIGKRRAETAQR